MFYCNVCRMPSIVANVKLFVLYDIPPKIKYKKNINKPKATNNAFALLDCVLNFCSILVMSTFDGFIDGFDCLSVDRFLERNFDAKVFFLSHCHTDHMQGLIEIREKNALPGPLYLSEISSVIIKKIFPAINQLIVLQIGGIYWYFIL